MQEVKIDQLPDIDVKELLIIQRQKIFIVIQLLLVLGTFQLQEYSFHDNIFFLIGSFLTVSLLLVLHKQQVTKQKFHKTIETAVFLLQILMFIPLYFENHAYIFSIPKFIIIITNIWRYRLMKIRTNQVLDQNKYIISD